MSLRITKQIGRSWYIDQESKRGFLDLSLHLKYSYTWKGQITNLDIDIIIFKKIHNR